MVLKKLISFLFSVYYSDTAFEQFDVSLTDGTDITTTLIAASLSVLLQNLQFLLGINYSYWVMAGRWLSF